MVQGGSSWSGSGQKIRWIILSLEKARNVTFFFRWDEDSVPVHVNFVWSRRCSSLSRAGAVERDRATVVVGDAACQCQFLFAWEGQ